MKKRASKEERIGKTVRELESYILNNTQEKKKVVKEKLFYNNN
jgi:hypothetical protein